MDYLSNIMVDALRFFAVFGGYGWGIVWLTIAVNLALYPLTLTSTRSMDALQKLQPRLQKLQKELKDKPKELQKATLELYRAEKVNPFGGCLPVVLKIPFFLALFWAFQSTAFLEIASNPSNVTSFGWISGRVEGRAFNSDVLVGRLVGAKVLILDEAASRRGGKNQYVWNNVLRLKDKQLKDVLWAVDEKKVADIKRVSDTFALAKIKVSEEDAGRVIAAWNGTNSLAKPDRVATPFGGMSILAILVGVSTYLMQKTLPAAGGQQMAMMNLFMPVFIVLICWSFPAGVQLYWLVSNLVGAVQQYFILKRPR